MYAHYMRKKTAPCLNGQGAVAILFYNYGLERG